MKFTHRFAFVILTTALIASLSLAALLPVAAAPVERPQYDLTDSLIAYWKLDETSGTRDDIVSSNDLTPSGTTGYDTGKISNALGLTGAGYAYHADNANLSIQPNVSFTISAWVRLTTTATQVFVSKWDGGPTDSEYSLSYSGSNFYFYVSRNGLGNSWSQAFINPPGGVSTGTWYFLVGWYDADADTINLQVNNGTPDDTAFAYTVTDTDATFRIGAAGNGIGGTNGYADGRIDEVGYWSRALSNNERTALYNSGYGCTHAFSNCDIGGGGNEENPNQLGNGDFEDSTTYLDPWELHGQFFVDEPGDGLQLVTGAPFCGNNYVRVDPDFRIETNYETSPPYNRFDVWRELPALTQRFFWPGGTAYFQARVRTSTNQTASVGILLRQVTTGFDVPAGLTVFDGSINPSAQWQLKQASSTLPAGWYDLEFSSGYEINPAWDYPISALWEPDYPDLFPPYYIDDVFISQDSYYSYCGGVQGGPTITPRPSNTSTPTVTRTPTGTIAVSATPTRTPTAGPVGAWSNCGFENGSAGWQGSSVITLAGGPIEPRYAQVSNGATMSQQFTMPVSGVGYFTFWIGPGSYGSVRIRNTSSQVVNTIHVAANPAQWLRRDVAVPGLVAGRYAFEVLASLNRTMNIDGVMVGINGFQYCSASGGGGTPITPTSGPTSYITATNSLTPQFSPTATRTSTPNPSRTPGLTNTPQPSNTPLATSTPIPTDTQSAAQQTATAQGTTIPTYTPYPTYTPAPTYTVVPPPPEQPEPSFYADCIRPQNAADLAGWAEYNACYSLSWFAWSDGNTQQFLSIQRTAEAKEPFGTVREVSQMWNDYRDLWQQYDWEDTGIDGTTSEADAGIFTQPASGILIGEFDLGGTSSQGSSTQCSFRLEPIIGPFITQPICFLYNTLHRLGALAWVQLLFDIGMLLLLIHYLQRAWVNKATQG